jgi:tetratricopeptide (TPR) repeat protein
MTQHCCYIAKRAIRVCTLVCILIVCIVPCENVRAQEKANGALDKLSFTGDTDTSRVIALNGLANRLRNQFPDSALGIAHKALELAQSGNYLPGIAEAQLNLGRVFTKKKDIPKARGFLLQSLQGFQELGDQEGQLQSLYNIGTGYYQNKDYKEALKYFEQSLVLIDNIGEIKKTPIGVVLWSLRRTGNILLRLAEYDRALDIFNRLLTLGVSLNFQCLDEYGDGVQRPGNEQKGLETL